MSELYANGARGRLNASITSGQTTLTLRSGQGALFPSYSGTDYSWVTIEQGSASSPTKTEIVQVTGRSGDVLTITRAQQGTTAQSFDAGARVALRLTAETLRSFQQSRGYDRRFPFGGVQPEGTTTFDGYGQLAISVNTAGGTRPVPTLSTHGTSLPRILGTRFVASTGTPAVNVIGSCGAAPNIGGMEWMHRGPLEEDLASTRKLLGISDSNNGALLDTLNPSALTTVRFLGVGYDDTVAVGGNWRVFVNNASTVQVFDTSIAKVVGHVYQTRIWSPRGVPKWYVEFIDLTVGSRYFNEFTSNIPTVATPLYPTLYVFRSGGSATFSIQGMWNYLIQGL